MEKKALYVLTGFLGAGKTSFLLNVLDNIKDKKIGIIQNEFGKINVDGEIIRRNGIEMTEISRGSIFCSCLKLSFVQALAEMSTKDLDYVFPSTITEGVVRTPSLTISIKSSTFSIFASNPNSSMAKRVFS